MSCLQAEVRFYYLDPNVEKGLPGISKLPIILKSVPRNLYHQPNMACSMCSFYRIAVCSLKFETNAKRLGGRSQTTLTR